ncbi:MAG: sulfur carrier protein ThiS [Solirubrobacteraceae bacterium]
MISVNGDPSDVAPGTTVTELLRMLDAPDRGVAVAIGGEVVARSAWGRTSIADEARVEVVMAVQGG